MHKCLLTLLLAAAVAHPVAFAYAQQTPNEAAIDDLQQDLQLWGSDSPHAVFLERARWFLFYELDHDARVGAAAEIIWGSR
jgi:hypothetical protein